MFFLTAKDRIEYIRLLEIQKNCREIAYRLAKQFRSRTISMKKWTIEMDILSRKIKETEKSIAELTEVPFKIVDGHVIIDEERKQ